MKTSFAIGVTFIAIASSSTAQNGGTPPKPTQPAPVVTLRNTMPAPRLAAGTPDTRPGPTDPRLESIAEPFRGQIEQEDRTTASRCEQTPEVSQAFECGCFAKVVLDYRIAHASEYRAPAGPSDRGGLDSLDTLLAQDKLSLAACVDTAAIEQYAKDRIEQWYQPQLAEGTLTAARVQAIANCTATRLSTEFAKSPRPFGLSIFFDVAYVSCVQ